MDDVCVFVAVVDQDEHTKMAIAGRIIVVVVVVEDWYGTRGVVCCRLVGRLLLVSFEVKSQVVRTGEAALTVNALEWLGTRVLAVVARQLVRTGKSPLTSLP